MVEIYDSYTFELAFITVALLVAAVSFVMEER